MRTIQLFYIPNVQDRKIRVPVGTKLLSAGELPTTSQLVVYGEVPFDLGEHEREPTPLEDRAVALVPSNHRLPDGFEFVDTVVIASNRQPTVWHVYAGPPVKVG